MPEKTKEEIDLDKESENSAEEPDQPSESSSWSEDQAKRSYYYDDACGYETYTDEDEEDE